MSYAHCRQSFFEKFRRQGPVNITRAIEEVKERTLRKVARNTVKHVDKVHSKEWTSSRTLTVNTG
jgi:hypothetical protein